MPISIETRFAFELDQPTDCLLQFEAAPIPEQILVETDTWLTKTEQFARVPAQDDIGERIWIRGSGRIEVSYDAKVELSRITGDLANLQSLDPHDLPGTAVEYLLDSRYCPSDRFQTFVGSQFGDTQGGARIEAIREWIADKVEYSPGASGPETSALDSFVERRGICRDFAHLTVAMSRASAIPARYVACYAPDVEPPDFHAVAEVFLADPSIEDGGAWHIVDATGMATASETVKIGVGRDAADVSFLTSFGASRFQYSSVKVSRDDA